MGKIQIGKDIIVYDDKFSGADFTGKIVDVPDKIIIYASGFSQEKPDTIVFPDKMTGVTFYNCNLDNCFIPIGNTLIDCSQRRFENQADGQDWIVDVNNVALQPLTEPATPVNTDPDPIPVIIDKILIGKWVWVPEPK